MHVIRLAHAIPHPAKYFTDYERSSLIHFFIMCATVRTEGILSVAVLTYFSVILAYFYIPDIAGRPQKLDIKIG